MLLKQHGKGMASRHPLLCVCSVFIGLILRDGVQISCSISLVFSPLWAWIRRFTTPFLKCVSSNFEENKIIRTHLRLRRFGSDYIGLVPEVGLEPTRCRQQRILSPSRLPIPSFRRKLYSIIIRRAMQHKLRTQTPHGSAAYAPPQRHE